ncbi:MAG TPA: PQQ-dependent sugar dehydrogenase [Blastocatellia bacterium]|nr:PQQ-dependent sugar dehydrogenase [Blastocatellia bacterium]
MVKIRVKFILICFAITGLSFPARPVRGVSAWSPPSFQEVMPGLTEVELETVVDGLDRPLFLTGAKDGTRRLFIVERAGRIKMLLPGDSSPAVFLDISPRVRTGGENGLLGLAFHPRYRDNRRFFVTYTREPDGAMVLAEYRALESNPSVAETSERPVTLIRQPSDIHHGGMIAFGADNLLYLSTGDGDWEDPDSSAQNIEELRGKILRIDVDNTDGEATYLSPPGNPFAGAAAGRDEIYALGFRNPWRFSIDRQTGELYVGDVGHDQMEEINLVTPGGNYGWRIFEGTNCAPFEPALCGVVQSIAPLVEYEHTAG